LPELPEQATRRLMDQYGITETMALTITADRHAITMFEDTIIVVYNCMIGHSHEGQVDDELKQRVPETVANWMCNDLFALVKESATDITIDEKSTTSHLDEVTEDGEEAVLNHPLSVAYSKVDAGRLGSLIALVLNDRISTTQGKKILTIMYKEALDDSPLSIAESKGWRLITDAAQLDLFCRTVVLDPANTRQLEQYKLGGKHVWKISKFFLGKIMSESQGNAHPELLSAALTKVLGEIAPGIHEK